MPNINPNECIVHRMHRTKWSLPNLKPSETKRSLLNYESRRRHGIKWLLPNLNPNNIKRSLSNLNPNETKWSLPNLNLEKDIELNDHCQI